MSTLKFVQHAVYLHCLRLPARNPQVVDDIRKCAKGQRGLQCAQRTTCAHGGVTFMLRVTDAGKQVHHFKARAMQMTGTVLSSSPDQPITIPVAPPAIAPFQAAARHEQHQLSACRADSPKTGRPSCRHACHASHEMVLACWRQNTFAEVPTILLGAYAKCPAIHCCVYAAKDREGLRRCDHVQASWPWLKQVNQID